MSENMKELAQRLAAVEELLDRADPAQTGIDFLELKRAVEDMSERLSTLDPCGRRQKKLKGGFMSDSKVLVRVSGIRPSALDDLSEDVARALGLHWSFLVSDVYHEADCDLEECACTALTVDFSSCWDLSEEEERHYERQQ